MKIEKKICGDSITLYVEGKLDTNTVSELEKEISDLSGINNLTFDFEKLDYISSSGLRLILKCKKTVNSTKVINCNSEVYEIFDMTGFTEMMEIDKAYRKISIDNCEKIGEGFFGNIYKIDSETIVKVYKVPDVLDMIKRERDLAKKAFVLGIPTAIPYDIVKVGDLYGTVFELLNAKSVVDLINSEEDLDLFSKKSAEILKNMHQREIKKGELPSRKETIIKLLEECKSHFTDDVYKKLLFLLNTIPETNTILHCDFHVKNIMMQEDELLLIDMDTLSVGHPIFDFGAMYATYEGYSSVDKDNAKKFLGMPLSVTTKLFDKIISYYYDDKTSEELDNIKQKLSVISYIQILNLRSKFNDSNCISREEDIEFSKNYLTDISSKLDTLNY